MAAEAGTETRANGVTMITQRLIVSYGTQFFGFALKMIGGILVARIAGPKVLGTVVFAQALIMGFGFLANPGFNSAHIKLISEGRDRGACISTYHRLIGFSLGGYVLLFLLGLLLAIKVFGYHFESPTHVKVILIWVAVFLFTRIGGTYSETFSGTLEQAKVSLPTLVNSILLQSGRVLVVILGFRAVGLSLMNLLAAIVFAAMFRYMMRLQPRGRYDPALARRYFAIALPLIVVYIADSFLQYLDKVFLQFFTDSEQVGYFSAGQSFSNLLLMAALAMGSVFFPLFSQATARNDGAQVRDVLNKFERLTYLFLLPPIVLLITMSEPIVRLTLGTQYVPTIPILKLLLLSSFIYFSTMPYINLNAGLGHFGTASKIYLLNLTIFIPFAILFMSPSLLGLKAIGAALSRLTIAILPALLFRLQIYRIYREVKVLRNAHFIIFALLNLVVANLVFTPFYKYNSLLSTLTFPVLYFIITYGFYFTFRWIDKEDWNLVTRVFNLKKLKFYISDELKH